MALAVRLQARCRLGLQTHLKAWKGLEDLTTSSLTCVLARGFIQFFTLWPFSYGSCCLFLNMVSIYTPSLLLHSNSLEVNQPKFMKKGIRSIKEFVDITKPQQKRNIWEAKFRGEGSQNQHIDVDMWKEYWP